MSDMKSNLPGSVGAHLALDYTARAGTRQVATVLLVRLLLVTPTTNRLLPSIRRARTYANPVYATLEIENHTQLGERHAEI